MRGAQVPHPASSSVFQIALPCCSYLILDPGEIGSAPMKYALHFIGQAFHRAGRIYPSETEAKDGFTGQAPVK
jgi:hypothetical protein